MPYSLLSRFQGGLGGSGVGGKLHPQDPDWLRWDQVQAAVLSQLLESPIFPSDAAFLPLFPLNDRLPANRWLSGLALGLLPLLLWEYESQPRLPNVVTLLSLSDQDLAWLWIWAIALHQGLGGQLPDSPHPLPTTHSYPFTQAIRNSITITPGQPLPRDQSPLSFALTCATLTPEDPNLSIHCAQSHSPLAAALTASLMGIYHGAHLPLGRGQISPTLTRQDQARQLFARWAGQDKATDADITLTLAPGGLLSPPRPRPLVSQVSMRKKGTGNRE